MTSQEKEFTLIYARYGIRLKVNQCDRAWAPSPIDNLRLILQDIRIRDVE